VLTINNDLGRSIYLGLKLYETCETGSFYNLSDSVGEGSFVKVTTYDKINQAIGEAPELYAYITIDTVKVPVVLVEGCDEAVEYTWNSDLSLSAGDAKWYKLSMIELRGKTCDITLTANNATAEGVILNDYDVTDGDQMAAVVIHGFVLKAKLPAAPAVSMYSTVILLIELFFEISRTLPLVESLLNLR
jgi:hypothetical protein